MKILKVALIGAAFIVVGFIWFMSYMGMFSRPLISERDMGPYTVVYEDMTGPYENMGRVIQKLYGELKAEGIETSRGLGVYLDNPRKVAPDKLRSQGGPIIEQKDLPKASGLKKKYNVMEINVAPCVVIEFPVKNDLSYMLGAIKNYAILSKYFEIKDYQMGRTYEIYDMPNKKIFYVAEIKK